MTKTQLKDLAKEEILKAISVAFYRNGDDQDRTDVEKAELKKEMDRQMRRVEKMFGYEPGSWGRD